MKKLDLAEVKAFIEAQGPDTKIYLGCDSERLKIDGKWQCFLQSTNGSN